MESSYRTCNPAPLLLCPWGARGWNGSSRLPLCLRRVTSKRSEIPWRQPPSEYKFTWTLRLVFILTMFIPESTADDWISCPPCRRPGNASQNATTRVSAKVRASKITMESPDVWICTHPSFSPRTERELTTHQERLLGEYEMV